ncbi:RICIN domain-containing protein [Kitasatospora sp. NPDC058184]|uniref:RICIN domain-containing protein n=1 Tax=Kitasatospora sp. NPDC058184 TaxID=3346370 RepID=UPI0036DAE311
MAPASHAESGALLFTAYNAGVQQMLDANDRGDNAITQKANGSEFQKWAIADPRVNGFKIRSTAKDGKCLEAPSDLSQPLRVADCADVPTQRWSFVIEGDKTLIFRADFTGEVAGATEDNTPAPSKDVDLQIKTGSNKQYWYISAPSEPTAAPGFNCRP